MRFDSMTTCSLHSKSTATTTAAADTDTTTSATNSSSGSSGSRNSHASLRLPTGTTSGDMSLPPNNHRRQQGQQQCRSSSDKSFDSAADERSIWLNEAIATSRVRSTKKMPTSSHSSRKQYLESSATARSSRTNVWNPLKTRRDIVASVSKCSTGKGMSSVGSLSATSTRSMFLPEANIIEYPSTRRDDYADSAHQKRTTSSSLSLFSSSTMGRRSSSRIRRSSSRAKTNRSQQDKEMKNDALGTPNVSRRRSSSHSAVMALIGLYDDLELDEQLPDATLASDSDKALRGGHVDPLPGDDETVQASGNGSNSTLALQSHEQCSSKSVLTISKAIREAEIQDNLEVLNDEIKAMKEKLCGLQEKKRTLIDELATTSRRKLCDRGIPEKISFDSRHHSQRKIDTCSSTASSHSKSRQRGDSSQSARPTKERTTSWKEKTLTARTPTPLRAYEDKGDRRVRNQVLSRAA